MTIIMIWRISVLMVGFMSLCEYSFAQQFIGKTVRIVYDVTGNTGGNYRYENIYFAKDKLFTTTSGSYGFVCGYGNALNQTFRCTMKNEKSCGGIFSSLPSSGTNILTTMQNTCRASVSGNSVCFSKNHVQRFTSSIPNRSGGADAVENHCITFINENSCSSEGSKNVTYNMNGVITPQLTQNATLKSSSCQVVNGRRL